VHCDYLEFQNDERSHLILMIMCDFCALSPRQRDRILTTFYEHLEPGGAVLLDVYSMAAFDAFTETTRFEENLLDGFWSASKYFGFLRSFKYANDKVTLDKYTIVDAARARTVYNWLQYFTPQSLTKEFADCGFSLEEIYADVAGTTYAPDKHEFAVVARKP